MKNTRIALLASITVGFFSAPVMADPILGGQLEFSGGEVTIEVMDASAGYHSFLGLYLFDGSTWVQVPDTDYGENHDTGHIVTFNPMDLGYSVGDEMVFGISVYRSGRHNRPRNPLGIYVMGPGERNPDGVIHATVTPGGESEFVVGFEDLWGGGDLDYNDNVFSFTGGVSQVPEPGVLLLMGAGLLGLAARRRRIAATA